MSVMFNMLLFPALSYTESLTKFGLERLDDRRDMITQSMFRQIKDPKHPLHYLLHVQGACLYLVVSVVVQNKDTIQFIIFRYNELRYVLQTVRQHLARVLLHLNVEEFPVNNQTL